MIEVVLHRHGTQLRRLVADVGGMREKEKIRLSASGIQKDIALDPAAFRSHVPDDQITAEEWRGHIMAIAIIQHVHDEVVQKRVASRKANAGMLDAADDISLNEHAALLVVAADASGVVHLPDVTHMVAADLIAGLRGEPDVD